jgi:hypothetical protein
MPSFDVNRSGPALYVPKASVRDSEVAATRRQDTGTSELPRIDLPLRVSYIHVVPVVRDTTTNKLL